MKNSNKVVSIDAWEQNFNLAQELSVRGLSGQRTAFVCHFDSFAKEKDNQIQFRLFGLGERSAVPETLLHAYPFVGGTCPTDYARIIENNVFKPGRIYFGKVVSEQEMYEIYFSAPAYLPRKLKDIRHLLLSHEVAEFKGTGAEVTKNSSEAIRHAGLIAMPDAFCWARGIDASGCPNFYRLTTADTVIAATPRFVFDPDRSGYAKGTPLPDEGRIVFYKGEHLAKSMATVLTREGRTYSAHPGAPEHLRL